MSGSMKMTVASTFLLAGVLLVAGVGLAQETDNASETPQDIQVEITFGTDVDKESRTVTGEATTFGTDLERVFCLTRIIGIEPPASVTHAWYYEGKTMARVDLKVGSPDWRTWSSKRYLPAWTGHWEVKVLDEAGKVLASAGFEIQQ